MKIRLFTSTWLLLSSVGWAGNVSIDVTEKSKVYLAPRVTFVLSKNADATAKLKNNPNHAYCILIDIPAVTEGAKINNSDANIHCNSDNDRNCPEGDFCRSINIAQGKHKAVLQYGYRVDGDIFSYGKQFSDAITFEVRTGDVSDEKGEPYATSGISIDTYAAYASTVDSLTIRAKPTKKSKAIGSLKKNESVHIMDIGKEVFVIDGKKAPWVLIQTDQGLKGFVFYGYLKALE